MIKNIFKIKLAKRLCFMFEVQSTYCLHVNKNDSNSKYKVLLTQGLKCFAIAFIIIFSYKYIF